MSLPLKRIARLLCILLLALLPAGGLLGSTPKRGSKAAVLAGAQLFQIKGCAHCHGIGGVGTRKAPSLIDLRKNTLWTPAKITDQILNGGQKMPPFGDSLTDEEINQLIDYLRAKHRPAPPPALPETSSAPGAASIAQ